MILLRFHCFSNEVSLQRRSVIGRIPGLVVIQVRGPLADLNSVGWLLGLMDESAATMRDFSKY